VDKPKEEPKEIVGEDELVLTIMLDDIRAKGLLGMSPSSRLRFSQEQARLFLKAYPDCELSGE